MGQKVEFNCPGCGYEAKVSGGEDSGFISRTTTVSCSTCRRLFDVTVAKTDQMPDISRRERKWRSRPVRCPRCGKRDVTLWSHPGPCPKCGAVMEQGRVEILWD